MRDLPSLSSLYTEIDSSLEDARARVADRADGTEVRRVEDKQRLNDQAYFVLCWGQFEAEINDRCRDVIRAGRQSTDWRSRRSWQMFDPDDRRLSGLRFKDRTALVLDRDAGAGSSYARVMQYYAMRNGIVHGRLRIDRLDVPSVVADFYQIRSEIS